jgi:betaine-aldehyde dehydrogenase
LGGDAGQPLCEHPGVDKPAFTGSVPTGARIMAAAARDIKNVSLQVGGKSPFLVFADSDIDKAVEWIMFGIFWNQGQVCSATSRILVEETLYPALLQRLSEEAANIAIGDGLDEGTLLGPLVSSGQYQKIIAMIEQAREHGATVAYGGKRPEQHQIGYFLEPTILTDMAEDSVIWREEIFGPVVCVKTFRDEADAIRMANDSRFGLAAAVMSQDEARCERVARALRAGIV